MAASSIFFSGRVISVPGSYSVVDASGLEQVGLGAAGIVGVLGTAEGGIPVSAITSPADFIRFTKPESARETFKSGDLREVADMLFAPAKDADILAGATEVVAMKVNPATQSTGVLPNALGDALDLTSADYGAFTTQVNVQIGSGTTKGKLITITFEDEIETADDIGGDAMFNLKYTSSADSWDTMTAQVVAGGSIECEATRDVVGLDGDVTALLAQGPVRVKSANAADVGQQVVVYGLDASGDPVAETLTLNGTADVDGSQVFGLGDVFGARVVGTTVGAVTVSDQVTPTTIMTIALGTNQTKGITNGVTMYVSGGVVTVVADAASTADLIVEGTNAAGAVAREKLTLNGTTAVVGVGAFTEITRLILGDVAAARTVTVSAQAAKSVVATQNTLQKLSDWFNAKFVAGTGGFVLVLATSQTTLNPENLDVMTGAVSILDPADPAFYADLYTLATWINTNSQFVVAAVSAGAAGGAPSNTTAPVFLAGGGEGTTAFANWQAALNLLKQIRVNSIVVLTGDPAVHAALDAHCAYMGGIGRSERDGFVGLRNTALTDVPTKAEAKAQVLNLNSRHIRACAQAIERYNTAGERAEFQPQFMAAVLAGMQAGSPIGTSLTHKVMNVLKLRQDTSWSPTDDAEELIQAGLLFGETVDGVGRRVVRNITTHLSSSNIAYTEGSVNEAVNYAVFTFRGALERAVGKRGFAGTVNATRGVALNILGLLKDENILTATRSLDIELIVDVLEVSCEISPIIPVNFVKTTMHLVTIPQVAA